MDNELENNTKSVEYDLLGLFKEILNPDVQLAEYIGNIEIAEIEGKGRGILATADIPKRQLICVSKAFAFAFSTQILENEREYFTTDTSNLTEEIIQICLDKTEKHPILRQKLESLSICSRYLPAAPDIKFLTEPHDIKLTEPHDNKLSKPQNETKIIDIYKIKNICKKNIFKGDNIAIGKMMNYPFKISKGLWLIPSFFNHSCAPNTIRIVIGDLMFIRAGKNIQKGEEICVSYQAPIKDLVVRKQNLLENWEFECDCRRCIAENMIPVDIYREIEDVYIHMKEMSVVTKNIYDIYIRTIDIIDRLRALLNMDFISGIPGKLLQTMLWLGKGLLMINENMKGNNILDIALNSSATLMGLHSDPVLGFIASSQFKLFPQETNGAFWDYLRDIFGEDEKLILAVAKMLIKL